MMTAISRRLALASPPALEDWYRRHLAAARLDISSSGVSPYTLGQVWDLTDIDPAELRALVVDDSESFGDPGLRRALADRYAGGRVDHVMATHGSSEAIYLVLSALCQPGRKVACLEPIYHSLVNVPRATGADVVPLPLKLFMGVEPDWESIQAIISDADVVIVNFPHNPTGLTLRQADAARLVDIVARANAYLVWDAALEHLTTGHEVPGNLASIYMNSVVFRTMSKAFGLPGLRVGWAVAPPELLERTLALHDTTTLFLSPIVEEIARHAIEHSKRLIDPRLQRAVTNRAEVAAWVDAQDEVSWSNPQAGVTALVTFEGVGDIDRFCLDLLRRYGVLLVPGTAFGIPEAVRLGFGGDSVELREALGCMSRFLREGAR